MTTDYSANENVKENGTRLCPVNLEINYAWEVNGSDYSYTPALMSFNCNCTVFMCLGLPAVQYI